MVLCKEQMNGGTYAIRAIPVNAERNRRPMQQLPDRRDNAFGQIRPDPYEYWAVHRGPVYDKSTITLRPYGQMTEDRIPLPIAKEPLSDRLKGTRNPTDGRIYRQVYSPIVPRGWTLEERHPTHLVISHPVHAGLVRFDIRQ